MSYATNPLGPNNTMYFSTLIGSGGGSTVNLISSNNAAPTSTSTTGAYDGQSITNMYTTLNNGITAASGTASTASATATAANATANSASTTASAALPRSALLDLAVNTAPTNITLTNAYSANATTNLYNTLNNLALAKSALIDLQPSIAPTSTSTTTAYSANAITNSYNTLNNRFTYLDLAANTAPTNTTTTNVYVANATTNLYNTLFNFAAIMGGTLSDENTTVLTATTNTLSTVHTNTIRSPIAFRITSTKPPIFTLNTAPTATITLDVLVNGTTIYSARPTIAAGATTSTAGTINTTAVAEGVLVRAALFNCPATNANRGLKFYIFNS